MTESDTDIYAKVTYDGRTATITNDATPITRGETPGLIDIDDIVNNDLRSGNWAHCNIVDDNGARGQVFVRPQDISAHSGNAGCIRIDRADEAVFSCEHNFDYTRAPRVISIQHDAGAMLRSALDNSEQDRIEDTGTHICNGGLHVTPEHDNYVHSNDGADWADVDRNGEWFVVYDAHGHRDFENHHSYEVFFPQEALQFRDSHHSRPPVEVEDQYSINGAYSGSTRNGFGVIATQCHRVSADDVPADNDEMRTVRENARNDRVGTTQPRSQFDIDY